MGFKPDCSSLFPNYAYSRMRIERRHGETRPSDEVLPQVLGLYAPFRSFGQEKTDMDMDKNVARSNRKRKRRHSSVSSYLEPATFAGHTEVGDDGCHHMKAPVSQGLNAELSPDTSVIKSIPQAKPNKAYERKPRHKTRENRYELKQVKEAKTRKKKKHEGAPKKERKRKRMEKSGASLLHNFTAQNVAHDRLTLRSEPTVGLFSKGRASLPVKRRGLPDLAFSELTFLNPRRENSDDLAQSRANISRHNKDKAADSGANISSYFTSMNSLNHNKPLPNSRPAVALHDSSDEREHQRYDDRRPTSKDRDPSLPLVELPEKPFLGFGSSGIELTSPAWISRNIGSTVDPPRGKPSSTRSTSYVSWSVSGAPSHHSPQLHYFDKTSTKSPIHVEHTRASTADVPSAHSEVQYLDRGRKQVDVRNDTYQECLGPTPKSRDPVPENDFANRSIQLAHQPISDSVKSKSSPKNPSNDRQGSLKESTPQQSRSNDKFRAASIEEGQVELPSLPVPDSSGGMSQEDSSILVDAELDNFLQKFKPDQARPVDDLARQPPSHCAQSEVLNNVDYVNSTNLEKATDSLSVSENKYTNTGVENSPSRHDSEKPSEFLSKRALEDSVNHTGGPSRLELLSPAPPKSPGSIQNRCRLGNPKNRPEHTVEWKPHDVFTRNAWSGYNNIYQQQTGIGGHDPKSNKDCEKARIHVDFEGPENHVAFHDLVNDVRNDLGGHDDYENIEAYDLNHDRVGGHQSDSHHEESTMSEPNTVEELFYPSTLTSGTELDVSPYRNGLLHRNQVPSGDFIELEDGYPYPPNHDLNISALPGKINSYEQGPDEKHWLEGRRRPDVRPQLRARNVTYDLGDNMRMASVQQNDDELPGFWKPHKRY